jgi:starch synthase
LVYADRLSTVSPRYAEEIQTEEQGFGLDGLLRSRRYDLEGILNGVDYNDWNPEHDIYIPANYSADDLSGKRACKLELLREFGLPEEALGRPLFGSVSRLNTQKGSELIAAAADEFEALDAYLVTLGSGDTLFEKMYEEMASRFPRRIGVRLGYDDALAHRIEAGADAFLMPSRYEPCGLNQIYSLRYGTIPIVRATGGLDDTIEESTGFKFPHYSEAELRGAVRAACAAYQDRDCWTEMMRRGMRKDFSWRVSAEQYGLLYQRLRGALNRAGAPVSLNP